MILHKKAPKLSFLERIFWERFIEYFPAGEVLEPRNVFVYFGRHHNLKKAVARQLLNLWHSSGLPIVRVHRGFILQEVRDKKALNTK